MNCIHEFIDKCLIFWSISCQWGNSRSWWVLSVQMNFH